MQVRTPGIDFSKVPAIWAPACPGFAHKYDGASLLLPYLEPFLIKVMRQAQQTLDDEGKATPELDEKILLFNKQEAQHYQLHTAYNNHLKRHYPGLADFEQEIQADFERMYAEESLAYNLGYSAGFETIGPVQTPLWFGVCTQARKGANAQVDDLWGWHLAEEFEHRSVAFEVYRALFSGSNWQRWRFRLQLFSVQNTHLNNFTERVVRHMLEADAEAGRVELDAAMLDYHRFSRRFRRAALPKVLATMTPWYDPSRAVAPAESLALLQKFAS